ncbi:MAG: hypothetical protein JL50_10105 [Peptococcaceae bacterium BICA1-7]|nr:MAG: hypothetical protein JL50_10105 [Peptococcaceae bacterium BICA1-7]HBV95636.1 hypothetical protein [Desulfotomaculum sp.]
MSEYGLDVKVAVSGDGEAKERLKALERFMESARSRAAALNRLKISPAIAIDDRISSPLRSVRSDLKRAGGMYEKVFRNAGTGITESLKPVFDSITDWFDFCRSKVDWWKSSLIQAGREAAERVLSEFQRAYAKIRKMFLDKLNFELDVAGKLLVEHRVIAFINNLGAGGQSSNQNTEEKEKTVWGNFKEKAKKFPADYAFKKLEQALDKLFPGEKGEDKSKSDCSCVCTCICNCKGGGSGGSMGERTSGRSKGRGKQRGGSRRSTDERTRGRSEGRNRSGGGSRERQDRMPSGTMENRKNRSGAGLDTWIGGKPLTEIGSGIIDFGKKMVNGAPDGAADLLKSVSKGAKGIPFVGEVLDVIDIATSDDKVKATAQAAGGTGGAMAGAALGAAVGSVVPIVGTVFGGILGGIAGSFGGDWLAGKAVDKVRSGAAEVSANPYGANGMSTPAAPPSFPAESAQNEENAGNLGGVTQNLTINVTVDSDMDRVELAQFVAERIAAEVRKITQNTTPAYCACGT